MEFDGTCYLEIAHVREKVPYESFLDGKGSALHNYVGKLVRQVSGVDDLVRLHLLFFRGNSLVSVSCKPCKPCTDQHNACPAIKVA